MPAALVRHTASFSDLLRRPKDVTAAAEHGEVRLVRRDGEDLVLASAQVVDRNRAGLELAAGIVAAAVADWPESFAEHLHQPFPWMTFLSDDEQDAMSRELVETARACASIQAFEPLTIAVQGWRATADAYARGIPRDGADIVWLNDRDEVERPEA